MDRTSTKPMLGKRFGKIVIIGKGERRSTKGEIWWIYRCDCGTEREVKGTRIRNGGVLSCGCSRYTQNGMAGENTKTRPTYNAWKEMHRRCRSTEKNTWRVYGAKGITVSERWRSFRNFLEDMGSLPKGLTLDRIDSSKGYSKENCRWADWETQANNTSRNLLIEYAGKKLSVSQWSREIGKDKQAIRKRFLISKDPYFILFGKKAHPPKRV